MGLANVRLAIATDIVSKLKASPLSLTDAQIIAENNPHPKTSTHWVQHVFKPHPKPDVFTLGSGGLDIVSGIHLVNIHSPLDKGQAFGMTAFEEFRKHFTAGKILTYSGQSVRITNCGANLGRVMDALYRADIAIYWEAQLVRGVG